MLYLQGNSAAKQGVVHPNVLLLFTCTGSLPSNINLSESPGCSGFCVLNARD